MSEEPTGAVPEPQEPTVARISREVVKFFPFSAITFGVGMWFVSYFYLHHELEKSIIRCTAAGLVGATLISPLLWVALKYRMVCPRCERFLQTGTRCIRCTIDVVKPRSQEELDELLKELGAKRVL